MREIINGNAPDSQRAIFGYRRDTKLYLWNM